MGATFTVQNLVIAVIIVLGALFLAGMLTTAMRLLAEKGKVPPALGKPALILSRWAILILAIVLILSIFGPPLSVVWGALAAAFAILAVGFIAAWSLLSNLSATALIFLTRPFNIGDRIEFVGEPTRGEVKAVGPMYTTLVDEEGHLVQVPNNIFFQKILRRRKSRDGIAPHLARNQSEGFGYGDVPEGRKR